MEANRNTFENVIGEDALDFASSVIVPFVSASKVVPDFSLSPGVSRKVVFDLEDGENEAQNTQMKKPLLKPSAQEIRKHNLTHLPFRSWCKHCVAGKMPDLPRKKRSSERDYPEMQLDYFFMNRRSDTELLTTLNLLHCCDIRCVCKF